MNLPAATLVAGYDRAEIKLHHVMFQFRLSQINFCRYITKHAQSSHSTEDCQPGKAGKCGCRWAFVIFEQIALIEFRLPNQEPAAFQQRQFSGPVRE